MTATNLLSAIPVQAHSLSLADVEGRVGEDTRRAGRYHISASRRGDGQSFYGFGETLKSALGQLLANLTAAGPGPADRRTTDGLG